MASIVAMGARSSGISQVYELMQTNSCRRTASNFTAAVSGVCVAIAPVAATPLAAGAPMTGYVIEPMSTATESPCACLEPDDAPLCASAWKYLYLYIRIYRYNPCSNSVVTCPTGTRI